VVGPENGITLPGLSFVAIRIPQLTVLVLLPLVSGLEVEMVLAMHHAIKPKKNAH
jgi:hypothetical protein